MDALTARKEIDELTEKLHHYNFLYYDADTSAVSDEEFDRLLRHLQDLEKNFPEYKHEDSPTERVGGKITRIFSTVVHKRPMLSLSNTYSREELFEWDERIRKALDVPFEYVCEQKFDGVAISLHYVNGKLAQAVTRGDGTQGDDITVNARTIRTIPLRLKGNSWPTAFEVRGEVFYTGDAFEKLNREQEEKGEELYANPRNTASGTLKLQDSGEVARRNLSCFCYFLLGDDLHFPTHEESLKALENWGFHVSPTYQKCAGIEEVWQYISEWDTRRFTLPMATDGIVVKVNNHAQQEILGMTAKSPRWAIAYKYKAASVSTVLREVKFQVGRTGAVTPVAEMAPVLLAGTIVKRATLHNEDEIKRLDLHLGDTVWVEKGGEIIPKIVSVDLSKRLPGAIPVFFITNCPECKTALVRQEEEAAWYCPNEKGCPPQIKGKIEHFIHRKAMNIDSLGEGKIEILFDQGLVRNIADLYDLTFEKVLGLEKIIRDEETGKEKKIGFREKTTENLLKGLEASKNVPFAKVLFALGIRYVGSTVSEKLASAFGDIDRLKAAGIEELTAVPEIGERIAVSIQKWFEKPENTELVERLRRAGVKLVAEGSSVIIESDRLSGKSFVISGTFRHFSREELQGKIIANGGRILSGVSAKLDYLIAGENMGPSKLEKAQKLGVTLLTEDAFLQLLL